MLFCGAGLVSVIAALLAPAPAIHPLLLGLLLRMAAFTVSYSYYVYRQVEQVPQG